MTATSRPVLQAELPAIKERQAPMPIALELALMEMPPALLLLEPPLDSITDLEEPETLTPLCRERLPVLPLDPEDASPV